MKIIVTGGMGFIGSALILHLVQKGHHVINADALTYAANPHSLDILADDPQYRFIKTDICDAAAIHALIAEAKPEAIMHLAAESHVDRSITAPGAFIQTNVIGTHLLLEATRAYLDTLSADQRKRFRFLHVSTDEVFGSLGETGFFDEETAYDPRSPYSASKAASDHIARSYGHTYGVPVIVTNCSNNYGPRQFPEKLIPLMILNAMEGKRLPIYGDGLNIRDWLYVEDHAKALTLAVESGKVGETYCIGGRAERTNRAVVETLCAIMDKHAPKSSPHADLIEFVSDRPGHDRRYAIDSTKIERELGFSPSLGFEEGLERTVLWYLNNPNWWQPLRKSVYSGKRLGLIAKP